MTVHELIGALQRCDPSVDVVIGTGPHLDEATELKEVAPGLFYSPSENRSEKGQGSLYDPPRECDGEANPAVVLIPRR